MDFLPRYAPLSYLSPDLGTYSRLLPTSDMVNYGKQARQELEEKETDYETLVTLVEQGGPWESAGCRGNTCEISDHSMYLCSPAIIRIGPGKLCYRRGL